MFKEHCIVKETRNSDPFSFSKVSINSPLRPLQVPAFPSTVPRVLSSISRVKGSPRNRRSQTTTVRFIGNLWNAATLALLPEQVSPRFPENRGNFNRFRILGLPRCCCFPDIVARVPPRFPSVAHNVFNPRGLTSQRAQQRFASPPEEARIGMLRFHLQFCGRRGGGAVAGCGRSCGSSVGDAFCGSGGRYAIMRIASPNSLSPRQIPRGFTIYRARARIPQILPRHYLFIKSIRDDNARIRKCASRKKFKQRKC